MADLFAYAASAAVSLLAGGGVLAVRGWYQGALEDRDAQIDRMDKALKEAERIIVAAERQGFIRGDHGAPQGRHAR
ncbi:hypothetical protein [Streptomonospora nanhaiensis]|uniref:hypothetical protein n=1 Tax=Streptomonospora nanhaiensis TaxID=1323731 RepID=UPI001C38B75C|nr:hypothetical protein [Streptomonospora nanhaiensis]MBV2366942.1 hypothetical protein [Streptomonospora nanhaiensis]